MANKRVRKGQVLYYFPTMLDRIEDRHGLKEGAKLRVIHAHGCPPPNTMGHCHVERADSKEFVGLVCTNSLHTKEEMEEAGKTVEA